MKQYSKFLIVLAAMSVGALVGCDTSSAQIRPANAATETSSASPASSDAAASSNGHKHGEDEGFHFTSLEDAILGESKCMDIPSADERYECLDWIADFWFHEGGNYVSSNPFVQMVRVMQIQLAIDPSDFEKMTNIVFYQYSNDVTAIGDGTATDFSRKALDTLMASEQAQALGQPANKDQFEFYNAAIDLPMLVIAHRQFGTDATKKAYYAAFKHNFTRAVELWATTDHSGYSADEIGKIEASFPRYAAFLNHYNRFE